MIAHVHVDAPVITIDRPFDYEVPVQFESLIEPGMRVSVPFGSRRLLGIVTGLSPGTREGLKPLEALLDETSSLTEELLDLSTHVKETTLCFRSSALLAMLPAALKVSYDKEISGTDLPEGVRAGTHLSEYPKDVQSVILERAKKGELTLSPVLKEKRTVKTDLVIELLDATVVPARAKKQREAIQLLEDVPRMYWSSLRQIGLSRAQLQKLESLGAVRVTEIELNRDPYALIEQVTETVELNDSQTVAVKAIREAEAGETLLLHGVTGSGKTEVYLEAIGRVVDEGRQAILLVPEISLTPMMVKRFKRRFGDRVAVLHSALSQGEKYDEWRKIKRREVDVVVGARSAVFAPLERVGLIILDEEHETTYKQEENPRYHARDVAIWRARYHGCPVVLGSATPSLESYARAQRGVYRYLHLKERYGGEMPPVHIIDMRRELARGNTTMFSEDLFLAINDRIAKKEQCVILLNRRGFTTFVMCRDCGEGLTCPHCAVNLTYHQHGDRLKCHYCGYEMGMPSKCPACDSKKIKQFGTGTQKIETELLNRIPDARIIRMDQDTTSRKGSHEQLLKRFEDGEADILLGTQMIAKGLDFPNVTLVGVLAADATLGMPDFRATERTFQLVTQVAGRAGRGKLPGEAYVQTYNPDHYVIETASHHDFEAFYEQEMRLRQVGSHPPYWYMTLVTVAAENPLVAQTEAEQFAEDFMNAHVEQSRLNGPMPAPLSKLKNMYRYQLFIKTKQPEALYPVLAMLQQARAKAISKKEYQLSIDVNPYVFM
ncbi:primosomal protein N' [Exiguobacterium sp.]|uniref:primosomal protein N' n=1 Tax=Exiguobacterium sp. TaxID=44751 RepID=UPI00263ADEC9|nr:primosomal protein N' [Exiguobacterium sp.]MCC5893087.1 primosomal protein N' [Exiguobacterium sp.]